MDLSTLGEFGFLEKLAAWLPSGGAIVGPGDDAAVVELSSGKRLAATVDLLVEDVHFRRDWSSWTDIGYKAAAVNISDLAAMGAEPRWLLAGIAAPGSTPVAALKEVAEGLASHGLEVIGGDTVRADKVTVSVAALGEVDGEPLTRSGARPGDLLSVTGTLGLAAAGVRLLLQGVREGPGVQACLDAHRRPVARVREATALRDAGVNALMDLSDGLASDLRRMCERSGCGAEIDAGSLPISEDLLAVCAVRGWDALELALGGGEDYELLAAGERPAQSTVIGRITAGGIWLLRDGRREPFPQGGWDHFRAL